ncbi:hypothetical protein PsalN5692_01494 [Piscirickettsia salmonis]|nr:hypothetical protein PsalN5692_01494 [Piscirickettsia salmonis]
MGLLSLCLIVMEYALLSSSGGLVQIPFLNKKQYVLLNLAGNTVAASQGVQGTG